MAGRRTTLCFDDYISESFDIAHGIDQGCPLSCIFYLFYNSALLEIAGKSKGSRAELAVGFIDDVALLARGRDADEATSRVKQMMERRGGALEWAKAYTSDFALEKTALITFTCRPDQKGRTVNIGEREIKSVKSHGFLGVIFDEELRWKEQRARVLEKAAKWTSLFRRISRVNRGLKPDAARRLHQSVLIPHVTYAADIWWQAPSREGSKKRTKGAVGFTKQLQSIQRMSALNITGALCTTPTDALDVHAGIFPIELELQKACHRAAVRLASLPEEHPLRQTVQKESKRTPVKHLSPLHVLFCSTGIDTNRFAPRPA